MSAALTGETVAQLQQEDLRFLLLSDDLFSDITVITEDDGNIEAMMNKGLGIITEKDGKAGVCVIVQQPTGDDDRPGITMGPLDLYWTFLVLEHREFNKDSTLGTTKKAWTVARRIHRMLKNHRAGGLGMNFVPQKPCIVPVPASVELGPDTVVQLVAYEVRFKSPEADTQVYTFVRNPTVSASPSLSTTTGAPVGTVPATVTLACDTVGASIFYTTDMSHPCSQNSNATLYSAPFSLTTACTLRVRAHKTGSRASDTMAVRFD
jgi:hypothetical protein